MIDTVTKYYFRGEHAGYVVTYKNSNITQSVPVAEDNKDYQVLFILTADSVSEKHLDVDALE